MSEDARRSRIDVEVRAAREEYVDEEAEAAETEIAERNAALDVPLSLRIDKDLDTRLKQLASAAQIPTSALVRRLLRQAVRDPGVAVLAAEQVEVIVRRVVAESARP